MNETIHEMKLFPEPFEMIASGKKTIELRLNDEKRRRVKTGDSIVFTNTETGERLETRVTALHRFSSFAELYRALPLEKCGYTEEEALSADPADMDAYYSKEEQQKYGALGIELALCGEDPKRPDEGSIDIGGSKLSELQPSQFYISEKKLRDIEEWFDPNDLSKFEPLPVKILDGSPVMTDGHTRAVAALKAGLEAVPLVPDEDELDWDMYRECVGECRKLGVLSPADLITRIISAEEYREKWDAWCDELHARLMKGRVSVKPFTEEDIPDVLSFEKRLREEESGWGWEIDEEYVRSVTASFRDERFKNSISLLAYVGGQAVGRIDAVLIPSRFDGSVKAYLDWICVIKSFRHCGIAQALLGELKRELKSRGVDTLIALTASNDEAQRFYRSIPDSVMRDVGIWMDIK